MPKISIIMPTYNSENYLSEAIESALNQTYKDFEIIVVDDGSTDNTRKLIQNYANTHTDRIKYFFQENKGPAAARNSGMTQATGEYIAFLDSDDTWLPYKLEKQIKILENNLQVGFIYCDNYFVNEKGEIISDYIRKVRLLRNNIALELFCDFFIITSSVILRKGCFEKSGYFNENLLVAEDYDFFLRLANAFNSEVIEEKLWKRRVDGKSLSRRNFMMDMRNDLYVLLNFLKENPHFYSLHKKRVLRRLADYYFSFAYKCLENGMNGYAFILLLRSVKCRFSIRAVKNIFFCVFPYGLRRFLKICIQRSV